MRRVAVIGVGNSKFGRRNDALYTEIAFEAVKEALEDAGIGQEDIGLSVIGCFAAGSDMYDASPAIHINEYVGLAGKPLMRVEAVSASGGAAIFTAYNAIASGWVDTAIAIGVEKMTEVDLTTSTTRGNRINYLWEGHMFGTYAAAYYALLATAHMAKYGTTEEDLALVAVKNRKYAAMNPKAHMQREITVDDVLRSRVVAWPLKVYDSCPISDGAAAAILASEDAVKRLGIEDPVWIEAIGVSSDTPHLTRFESYTGFTAVTRAAQMAYKMSKIEPKDVEVAVVHDSFTIAEIIAYEDLGFVKKGDGAKLIREGQTYIGGKIPVNIDGGLIGMGHPVAATGISMIYELVKQLRNEAGKRQVPLKKYIGLAHNTGGVGMYAYITILRR